jgi:uncharacterized protein (TIGR00266 family)
VVDAAITGPTTPVLTVTLAAGESVTAESGELSWLGGDVSLETGRNVGMSQGGFLKAAKRALGGGTFFMTRYSTTSAGFVAFAAKAPGEIRELTLDGSREYAVHRHGFVCCEDGVELSLFLQQKLGVGVFGHEGFFLQKLSGKGRAFVELHGQVVNFQLAQGQEMRVHPGHLGLFEATVGLELTTVPGIRNKLFGGDGLFLARLKGPGEVWLQSITLAGLAHALQPYIVTQTAAEGGALAGGAAILGSLIRDR